MKKVFKIGGIFILILIAVIALLIVTYQPKKYSDFDVFASLRGQIITLLNDYQAQERPITKEFVDFALQLSLPYNKIFGCDLLGMPLKSFANEKIAAATISQFEVPAKSAYFRDFTLNIRPQYGLKAPVLHIDFMKPALGTPGLCSMDFFNVDPEAISVDDFFGSDLEKIKQALAMVAAYQRTVAEGRGKITKYLDPYKSAYRFELKEPEAADEAARQQYYQAVEAATKLVFPVYFARLHGLQPDSSYAARHEAKTKEMLQQIYKKDFAISMGKKIFKQHFRKYWLDGFWNVNMELK